LIFMDLEGVRSVDLSVRHSGHAHTPLKLKD